MSRDPSKDVVHRLSGTTWEHTVDTRVRPNEEQYATFPHGRGMTPWAVVRAVGGCWQAGAMGRWSTTWAAREVGSLDDAMTASLDMVNPRWREERFGAA
jgi:hypothetical protein